MKLKLDEAKRRLRIPELARRLGVTGEIPDRDGHTVSCWWRDRHANQDRNPSFNLYGDLTRFHCFSCGIAGDGPDLISSVLGVSDQEGVKRFLEMAGGERTSSARTSPRPELLFPGDLSKGSEDEWRSLSRGRALNPCAVNLAAEMGVLKFGTVCGFHCWLITDESRKVAEARRLDGQPFPRQGKLPERKAHTLAGSLKSWPVGIETTHARPERFQKILVCEGGPDLLAAYHFLFVTGKMDALSVSILGRANKAIHSGALKHFEGRSVRIYPHADKDGGGMNAALRWAGEFRKAGAKLVDGFSFDSLSRRDGKPVSDLNDCTVIADEDQPGLAELLP